MLLATCISIATWSVPQNDTALLLWFQNHSPMAAHMSNLKCSPGLSPALFLSSGVPNAVQDTQGMFSEEGWTTGWINEWTGLHEDNLWMLASLLHFIMSAISSSSPEDGSYIQLKITHQFKSRIKVMVVTHQLKKKVRLVHTIISLSPSLQILASCKVHGSLMAWIINTGWSVL